MKKYIDTREKTLIDYIKEKTVLDLGVGDTSDRFLHKFISDNAKEVIGVELDEKRAEKLKNIGYKIHVGNAEEINLNKKFDVVIAGDLIEHVNNVGLFLENVKRHLQEGGYFIFNTPNIFSINFLLRGLFFGGNVKQFPEHVYGFNKDMIRELARRYNLSIKKEIYFSHHEKNIRSYIIRLLSLISKRRNENILYVIEAKD
ncbi:MAG: class I SAM-dependent methyltransferase [Candidatus Absconditabacterales bacterium]